VSKESRAAIEFHNAELIEVKASSKTTILPTIEHMNNGRSFFSFVPDVSFDNSDGLVVYYLNVQRAEGDEG
jgi:hypothetical protein